MQTSFIRRKKMTEKEKRLKRQLDRTWVGLNRMANTAMNLDDKLDKGSIDIEFAFSELIDYIKWEWLRTSSDCLKIEEEKDND